MNSNTSKLLSYNVELLLKSAIPYKLQRTMKYKNTKNNDKNYKTKKNVGNNVGNNVGITNNRSKLRVKNTNYIEKMVSEYYDNDLATDRYLKTAHKQIHYFPEQRRVIVIGDIHGDLDIAIKCLILAGCISYIEPPPHRTVDVMDSFFNSLEWIGGDTHIVQLGDQIDRVRPQRWDSNDITKDRAYEDEGSTLEIFYLFHHMNKLALQHGGRVLCILGNHEIMNVEGDFRYVSQAEFKSFKHHLGNTYIKQSKFPYHSRTLYNNRKKLSLSRKQSHHKYKLNNHASKQTILPAGYRERIYAFSPTGLCANYLATNYYTLLQIGNWLFCHGSPTFHTCTTYSTDLINNIVSMYLLGIDSTDIHIENHFDMLMNPSSAFEPTIQDAFDEETEEKSILWSRTFGNNIKTITKDKYLTQLLDNILEKYNNKNHNNSTNDMATHIAIGHTPQTKKGINSICSNRVWRCDIGMSKAFKKNSNNSNTLNKKDNKKDIEENVEDEVEEVEDDNRFCGMPQVLEIINNVPKILQ